MALGTGRRRRIVYLGAGYAFVAVGAVGVVLPLLPTTPFLLLAVAAFLRSDPAIAERLLEHRRFGPLLRSWRSERAIPTRAKAWALCMMAASWLVILATTDGWVGPTVVGLILACTATFVATRPAPRAEGGRT